MILNEGNHGCKIDDRFHLHVYEGNHFGNKEVVMTDELQFSTKINVNFKI